MAQGTNLRVIPVQTGELFIGFVYRQFQVVKPGGLEGMLFS
jgi:hypothetical protein